MNMRRCVFPVWRRLLAPALMGLMLAAPALAEEEHGEQAEQMELKVDALRAQGVVVEKAARRQLGASLQAPAVIGFNETQRAVLTARTAGWVENVLAFSDQTVEKGQLLATVYSPEFQSAQHEYLLILDRVGRGEDDRELAAAAEQRLRILGLTDENIRMLAESRTPFRALPVNSPIAGTVIEHRLHVGDAVPPGQTLYVIASLDTVWAHIDITESQLRGVRAGQRVRLTVEAYPGQRFAGRIVSLGASMAEGTRTIKARALIENPQARLKAGMFARAEIMNSAGETGIAVPDEAIVLLKGKPTVFKAEGGVLRPQGVEPCGGQGGWTRVCAGLEEGDPVAVKGTYLLKSLLLKSELGEGD